MAASYHCLPDAEAAPGSSWQPEQQQHRRCLWEHLGGGANQLQQIFRPLNSTVAPILGWDPPQVLMGG